MSRMKTTSSAGFSLLEALVALALFAMVITALGTVAQSWLPHWSHGFARLQREDQFATVIERLSLDISGAEFVPVRATSRAPLFQGGPSTLTFVRNRFEPNNSGGLEIVRYFERKRGAEYELVRGQAPYPYADVPETEQKLSELTTVLRSGYRIQLSYAGTDRIWHSTWEKQQRLPASLKLSLTGSGDTVAASIPIHTQIPLECMSNKSLDDCFGHGAPGEQSGRGEANAR